MKVNEPKTLLSQKTCNDSVMRNFARQILEFAISGKSSPHMDDFKAFPGINKRQEKLLRRLYRVGFKYARTLEDQ